MTQTNTATPRLPAPLGAPHWSQRATGLALILLSSVYAWSVVSAPIDRVQGIIQKILYVHVPCAFAAYLGFFLTALFGALYLAKRKEIFDKIALASAEVGVLFCTLVIVTGPIWARGTWGAWWTWDPRLTVTLLLWFVYLAYLMLRAFTDGGERAARFAAVYGIVGLLVIPLNYFAIDLFGGGAAHPDNLERDSLGAGMGLPFFMGTLTALAAFAHLLVLRVHVEILRLACANALQAHDETDAPAKESMQ